MTRAHPSAGARGRPGQPRAVHERRPPPGDRPRRPDLGRPRRADVVEASFAARPDILSVKVWRPDGDPRLDERRARAHRPDVPGRRTTWPRSSRRARPRPSSRSSRAPSTPRSRGWAEPRRSRSTRRSSTDGDVIGAFEIYADAARIEKSIAARSALIWLATVRRLRAAVARCSCLLVRGASAMLRRQTDQLRKRSKDADGRRTRGSRRARSRRSRA